MYLWPADDIRTAPRVRSYLFDEFAYQLLDFGRSGIAELLATDAGDVQKITGGPIRVLYFHARRNARNAASTSLSSAMPESSD